MHLNSVNCANIYAAVSSVLRLDNTVYAGFKL